MATTAAILDILVRAQTASATANLTRLDGQMRGTASRADAYGRRIATGIKYGALAAGVAGAASAKMAVDFDRSMRNVNSIAQLPEKQLDRLGDQVTDLAGKTAQAPLTISEGLYDLVSSGFDANKSMKVLTASAKGATAGLTDTATSTKAVAAVLNAYHQPASKASKVTDTLFRTVDRGVISFEDLSSTIGDVLPFASSLGVKLSEVGAATATMTKAGISPSETMTRLKAIMSSLLKPSEDLTATISDIGYDSGEAMVKTLGLQGTLEALSKATGGSKTEMAALFPNIRALGGALALTGENTRAAEKDLRMMADASGATDRALSEQSKSIAYRWNKLQAQAKSLAIDFGEELLPAIGDVIDILTSPKLTLDEKIAKLGGKLADVVKEWGPKVAKAGANLGISILKGIAKAWWDSDILGKLFIGAAIVRLMGGWKVIEATGKLIGTRFGKGMGRGVTVGVILGLAMLVPDMVKWLTKHRFEIRQIGVDIGNWIANALVDAINLGIRTINDVMDKANILGKLGVDAPNIPEIPEVKWDPSWAHAPEKVDQVTKSFKNLDEQIKGVSFKKLIKGLKGVGDDAQGTRRDLRDYYRELSDDLSDGNDAGQKHQTVLGRALRQISDSLKDGGGDLRDYYRDLAQNFDRSNDKARDLRQGVGGNATQLSLIVGDAFGTIGENTNNILSSLGAKKINFIVKSMKSGKGAPGTFATGGVVVPGSGSGDKVPLHVGGQLAAMVEPGEYVSVANRNATKALMAHNDRVPRFASGGLLGAHATVSNFVRDLMSRFGGGVGSGYRPGGTSLHSTGQAIDYSPADWAGAAAAVNRAGPSLLEGIYNPGVHGPPAVSWDSGARVPTSFWGASTWADHMDHIHIAIADGAKVAAGVAAKKIKDLILKGPDGPPKDIGQAAIDKATKAADAYIAKHAPKVGVEGSEGLGKAAKVNNLPASLRKYNQRYEAHWAPDYGGYAMPPRDIAKLAEWAGGGRVPGWTMQQVTEGESGGRPGSAGVDPGGTKGYGLWAITSPFANSLVAPYGGYEAMWNPVLNALVMAKMYPTGWSGGSPWYGTSHVSDYNKHYTGKLQRGGIVDIPKAIRRTLGATDGKDHTAAELRKRIAHRLGKQIKHFSDRGIPLTRDGGELAGRLANLRADVDRYGSYASNAGRLTDEGILGLFRAGTEDDISGYTNGSEAYWTFKQLGKLLDLRNALIAAEKLVDKRRKRVMELLEQSKVKLREWEKRLRQAEHVLGQKGKSPEKWKGVNPATGKVEEWNKLADDKRAALAHKFTAAGGRLPGDRKFLEDGSIATPASHPGMFPNVAGMKGVRSLLQNTVIPGLTQERSDLRTGMSTLLAELDTVQGNVPDMRPYKTAPALGVLGGEIFDAQSTLASLGADASRAATDSDLADLLKQQLAESRRENALLRAQMPVFRSAVPYMGAFASGGVALVGERGPELATMPSGTRITSAEDTRAMLEPEISLVLNDCTIDTHGKSLEDTVKVLINGELRSIAQTSKGRAPSRV